MDGDRDRDSVPGDHVLKEKLLLFLQHRQPPKTFCPSEVARALTTNDLVSLGYEDWRDAMPRIRGLAWQFRQDGELDFLQKGDVLGDGVVALEDIKGPIRLRRSTCKG